MYVRGRLTIVTNAALREMLVSHGARLATMTTPRDGRNNTHFLTLFTRGWIEFKVGENEFPSEVHEALSMSNLEV
jgi:hypothetical protein